MLFKHKPIDIKAAKEEFHLTYLIKLWTDEYPQQRESENLKTGLAIIVFSI
ncbi:MAG: hypothetical protein ACOCUQ_02550 [Bacteroidota bacterium]